MKVLIACEYSGRVRDAFLALGHDAVSCDLEPAETEGPHLQADVVPLLQNEWDLIIAHPPCTYLSNSGVRWLHEKPGRWEAIGEGPAFTVQPWHFGDNVKKRTCFWTRGLDPLQPTSRLDGSTAAPECHHASPGPNRWKDRSRTYAGIARAMAEQWGASV